MQLVDAATGVPAEPVVADRKTGRVITPEEFTFGPGPAANERMLGRLALIAQTRAKQLAASPPSKRGQRKT
jgi:hypothetical protein